MPVFCIVITEFRILGNVDGVHLVFELRKRNQPSVVLSNHLEIHFLRFYELLQSRFEVLESVSPDLRHWLFFGVFGGLKGAKEMSQIVERRRKLWKLEYYSGLEAAKEEVRGHWL